LFVLVKVGVFNSPVIKGAIHCDGRKRDCPAGSPVSKYVTSVRDASHKVCL